MAYELSGPVFKSGTSLLRRVDLMSLSSRSRDTEDYVKVRVGIRRDGNTDWLGTFTTSTNSLSKGSPEVLFTGAKRVTKGSFPVVEITKTGSPSALIGSSVTFSVSADGSDRGSRSGVTHVASNDQAVRSLSSQINQSTLGDRDIQVQLTDEAVAETAISDQVFFAASDDDDSTDRTKSNTSYADGEVSVTVTLPSGVSTAYVQVVASATWVDDVSLVNGFLAIGDGSTDHNEQYADPDSKTAGTVTSTSVAGTISATTTFTARYKVTSGTGTVKRQAISVLATGLYS